MRYQSVTQMREYSSQDREFGDDLDRIEYVHDLSGNLTFLNKTGELITGYSAEEARQMNIAQVVTPEFIGQLNKQIAHMLSGQPGFVFEVDVIAKDGRRVALEVSTQPIVRDGRPVEIRGIAVPSVLRSGLAPPSRPEGLYDDFVTFRV